jgi:uridylate kinase
VGIVVGGGNLFRGATGALAGMDRATADSMGMLATVMNALALKDALMAAGVEAVVQTAVTIAHVGEAFERDRAMRHLARGRVVIFGGGTGNPFFTTDTAAALRAAEMGCDALLKGTRVDGVYSADPRTTPDATRYDRLDYTEMLARDLKVMDASAVSLMRDNRIPIVVFSIRERGGLAKVLDGSGVCTVVSSKDSKRA